MDAIKTVKLASANFRVFIKQKKYLFFIILIGLSVSISTVLFYAGYLMKSYEDITTTRDVTLQLKLSDNTDTQKTIDTLLAVKDNLPERITLYEQDPNAFSPQSSNAQEISFIGDCYFKELPKNLLLHGDYLDPAKNNQLLATPLALKQLGIKNVSGQRIRVGDKEYTLAGLVSSSYCLPFEKCVVVSPEEFIVNHTAGYLYAEYDKTITGVQIGTLSNILSNLPGITIRHMPGRSNPLQSSFFLTELAQIILIFFLSFINIFSLLHFWIESNNRNYSIYALLGASKTDVTCILVVNNIAISFACILLGTGLFSCVSPLLLHYKIVLPFTLGGYSFILLILVVLSLVLSVILSIRYNRNEKIYRISGE